MQADERLPSECRALVPLEPAASDERVSRRAPPQHAAFVAHLIATAKQVPQTRERRRAEPDEAIAAYNAAIGRAQSLVMMAQ